MTGERRAKGKKKSKDTVAEVAHSRYEGLESPDDEFSRSSSKWRSKGSTEQQSAASHSGRWLSCIFVVSVLMALGAVACVFYGSAIARTLEEYGVDTNSIMSGLYPRSLGKDASAASKPDEHVADGETPSSPSVDDSVAVERDANILPDGYDDELPADAIAEQREPADGADYEEPLTAEAAETYAADLPEGGEVVPTVAGVSGNDEDVVLSIGKAQDDHLPSEDLLADDGHLPQASLPSDEDQASTDSDQSPASSLSDGDQVSADDDQAPASDASADNASTEQEREEAPTSYEHLAEPADAAEQADLPRAGDHPSMVDSEGTTKYVRDDYKEADTDAADGADFSASPVFTQSPEDIYLNELSDDLWQAPEEELAETNLPEEHGHLGESSVVEDAALSQPGARAVVDDELHGGAVPSRSEAEAVDDGELPFQGDVESDATLTEMHSQTDAPTNNFDATAVDADDSTQQQTLTFAEEQILFKDQGSFFEGAGPPQSIGPGDAEGESMAPAPPRGFPKGEVEAESIAVAPTEWEFLDAVVGSGSPAPDAGYIEGADSAGSDEESSERAPAVEAEDLRDLKFEASASADTSDFAAGDSHVDSDESAPAASAWDSINVDPQPDTDQEPLISSSWDRADAASEYPTGDDIVRINDDEMARSIESVSAYVDDGNILRLKDDEAAGMAEAASAYMQEGDMFRTRRSEPANGYDAASEHVDDEQIHQMKFDGVANSKMADTFTYGSSDPDSEDEPTRSESAADVDGGSRPYEDDDAWSRAPAAVEAETAFIDGYFDTEVGNEPASASARQPGDGGHSEVDNEAWLAASAADSASDPNFVASSFSDSEGDYQATDEDRSAAYE